MEGMENGKNEISWKSRSLEQKVRWLGICTAAVVILSLAAVMSVAGYGMKGMGDLLQGNSQSLSFWSAMDREQETFKRYAEERTPENKAEYEAAVKRTGASLGSLPFDYRKIGAKRYASTWSILNMYETYSSARDYLLDMDPEDPEYLKRLYLVYRVQGYLRDHAGNLEQMTVQQGNEKYEARRPLFAIVPAVSILWGAAALVMVAKLNRSVQRSIVRPLVELAEDSKRIGENDFSGPDPLAEGEDEIASLVQAFCSMKASTKGYIEALTEKHRMEKQLDEVRLQMLKNQINPHFLFNTLNMIASTAEIEDAHTTEKMIHALSRLFRYNLKSTDSLMPLGRELKVVQDYMYLQQMRFGKRIRYETECSPDTLEVLVPSFALQPLVENAIIHGLSSKGQGGRIYVRSWMRGKRLWISVADTGTGISRERLEEIRKGLEAGDERVTGVGVGNIYRRIHGMYEDGELLLYSKEGCGTVVQMAFTP